MKSRRAIVLTSVILLLISFAFILFVPHNRTVSVTVGRPLYPKVNIDAKLSDSIQLKVKNQDPSMYQAIRLPDLGVDVLIPPETSKETEIRASSLGNFQIEFYAGLGEDSLHRYMTGELVVAPHYSYFGGILLTVLTVLAVPFIASRRLSANPGIGVSILPAAKHRFNLLRLSIFDKILRRRGIQYALILPCILLFELVIITGFFGTSFGPANFSTVFVWTLWWFALIGFMVPFGARTWCAMCPLPAFGEWLQRGTLVRKKAKGFIGLGRRWPVRARTTLLSTALFVSIALFSEVITSNPFVTAVMMLSLTVAAIVFFVLFERRTFCRYICPIGGFIGVYSQFAPVELRVKDTQVCLQHLDKECVKGNSKGYGCPWLTYPGGLQSNQTCGLCFECIKTCSLNNVVLNLRAFGHDLLSRVKKRWDEAFTAAVMLSLAILYAVVWFGPWEFIRLWALFKEGYSFMLYAALYIGASMALMPAIYFGVTAASRRVSGLRNSRSEFFSSLSPSLIPIGVMTWISFILGIMSLHLSYVVPVLSDPFGWGWNLFGTKTIPWSRLFPEPLPFAQVSLVLVGLVYSGFTALGTSYDMTRKKEDAVKTSLPLIVFLGLVSIFLVWIFTK
ncbi:MAG: 4Fe-4S binding protein [Thaumarchaeota archaeon]|nr:4Fe-4S binding protein [Nitrososphaerota archaeon]